jgi:hypothetical protein
MYGSMTLPVACAHKTQFQCNFHPSLVLNIFISCASKSKQHIFTLVLCVFVGDIADLWVKDFGYTVMALA